MRKLARALGWIVAVLVIAGLVVRTFFVDTWVVPEEARLAASVVPTLRGGDVVLVLKGTPGFGDLTRCTNAEDKPVVGRVAGRVRDRVITEGRELVVNDKRYDSESACPEPTVTVEHPVTQAEETLSCDVVMMGSGWHYRGFASNRTFINRTMTDVGEGMFYLLSDDRTFHYDSRDYGTVPADSCKGRIFFRLWSKAGFSDANSRFSFIR